MRCKIAGQHFYLEVREIEAAMQGVEPEPLRGACAQIGDRWYPVVQIGAKVTGQDRRDFTAAEISRALSRPRPAVPTHASRSMTAVSEAPSTCSTGLATSGLSAR